MPRVTLTLALWFIVVSGTPPGTRADQDAPEAEAVSIRSIPGLTGPDTHPEACVSCHIQMDDIGLDARLSTALRMWENEVPQKMLEMATDLMESPNVKGKHPAVASPLADVPSSCIDCHEVASTAPPFAPLMHLAHYRGGEENHFVSIFAGECSLCHKMDRKTGVWRMPDGSEK